MNESTKTEIASEFIQIAETSNSGECYKIDSNSIKSPPNRPSSCSFQNQRSIKTEYLLIFCFSLPLFAVALSASVQNPFVTLILKGLGSSPLVCGVILSLNQISAFLSSMFFGYLGEKSCFGRTIVLFSGLIILGITTALLGSLTSVPTLAVIIFIQGLGTAATFSTVYSLVADFFPTQTTKVLSIVETCQGIGWVVGPLIAGYLWIPGELSALVPFLTFGVIQGLVAIFSVFVLTFVKRKIEKETDISKNPEKLDSKNIIKGSIDCSSISLQSTEKTGKTEDMNLKSRLKFLIEPLVILSVLATLTTSFAFYAVYSALSDFLSSFVRLNVVTIGWLYSVLSSFSVISSFVIPFITKFIKKSSLIILAVVSQSVLYLILSGYPLDHAKLSPNVYIGLLALVMCTTGFFYTLSFVLPNLQIMESVALKYPKLQLNGLCTGLFVSSTMFGDSTGLIIGGLITQRYGFKVCSVVIAILLAIISPILCFLKYFESKKSFEKNVILN